MNWDQFLEAIEKRLGKLSAKELEICKKAFESGHSVDQTIETIERRRKSLDDSPAP